MKTPETVVLKNIPAELVADLDALWPLIPHSGHVMSHKHAGEYINSEARIIGPKRNGKKK